MAGVSIIIDDLNFPSVDFVGAQWTHEQGQNSAYNGTLTVCHTEDNGTAFAQLPSFDISFFGTDIVLYGTLTAGVAFNYTVDESTLRPAIFTPNDTEVGKIGIELWSLKDLENTTYHTVQLSPSAGDLTIDYITYTPTKETSLVAVDLILDDQSPALQYSAGWTNTTNTQFPAGVPYLGTTTGTNTKGSNMTFSFVGSSISVYGVLQQADGRLSASFSIDGGASTTFSPFNGSQTVNPSTWLVSQELFHQDLAPNNHTLLVTLDDISGSQTLWIDSVVFEGTSATTLSDDGLPIIPSTATPSSTSSFHLSNAEIGAISAGVVILLILYSIIRQKIAARKKRLRANTPLYNGLPTSIPLGSRVTSLPRPPQPIVCPEVISSLDQTRRDGRSRTLRRNRMDDRTHGPPGDRTHDRGLQPQVDGSDPSQQPNVETHAQEDGRDDDPGLDDQEGITGHLLDAPPAYSDSVYD